MTNPSPTYSDYLSLDTLLSSQHPRSSDHNEMLFIVQHQTSELWMKLMLHELRAAIANLHNDALPAAFKMLARVSRIMEQLVSAWTVLSTMTPSEYSTVRPYLGTSSGFQSSQYREIEFLLGNKSAARVDSHQGEHRAHLEIALRAPSIYDEAIGLLARSAWRSIPCLSIQPCRGPSTMRSKPRGWWSIATPNTIGGSTNSPKN